LRLLAEKLQPSAGVANDHAGRKLFNNSEQFCPFRIVGEHFRGVQERRAAGPVKEIGLHHIIACGCQSAGHGLHFRADAKPIHEENDGGPEPRAIGIEHMGIGGAIHRFDVHGLLGQGTLLNSGVLMWAAARFSGSKAGGTRVSMEFSDSMNST
jgi:hypothetical protein